MLQPGNTLHGFTVKSTEELSEIDGHAIVMDHAKSGAKLLYLQNEDENKAFSIAFKTPPADDTGVFHILEHSVLCGSDKFPVKEPFVNLLRTSMQTFLNAMTFSDKTMYPVASTNEQDLLNLMDVYLDAVLHPMLYSDQHIFEQEGWHYELADAPAGNGSEKQLVYNGVVFNEMKGALADPEDVLFNAMNRVLFPGTCYAYESGGHPRAIPTLTYENYCDTHARHYRLDNSYIVLYGDMDIDRILGFLDTNYLGVAEEKPVQEPNPLGIITPTISYDNVVEMATAPENACVGLGYVIGSSHNFERVLAVDILFDALMGGNEAPIKRAVLDSGLGGDCVVHLIDAQESPALFFVLKNAKPGVADEFRALIENEVRKLVENGIPRNLLEASLAQMAFILRERDRSIADGVVLAMNALSGWLYNDSDVTTYLHFEEPLAHLRAGLEGSYFEDVLASLILHTDHAAMVDLRPAETGNAAEEEAELAAKMQTLEQADLDAIEADVAALRVRQEAPDSPEALAMLPQLHVSDIGPAKEETAIDVRTDTPLACLYHNLSTRRICYLYLYFNLDNLAWEDIPYVTLLALMFGKLDTSTYSAAELDVHIRRHLGALNFLTDVHTDHEDTHKVSAKFVVSVSALEEELEYLASIPKEVWSATQFSDIARMRTMLTQKRIALEESFLNEGHLRALMRSSSYVFETSKLGEALGGVDFYLFLKDLLDNFDDRIADVCERLDSVRKRIFTAKNCTVSFTGSQKDFEQFWDFASTMGLPEAEDGSSSGAEGPVSLQIPAPSLLPEAFITPSEICYVGKTAHLGKLDYNGSWIVLRRIMGFDYLWNEVRVKGGAYGCGFRSSQSGRGQFYSYRDPQLDATLERFDNAGQWLASFDPEKDEMEGYIVSSVAAFDAPEKPRAIARRQDGEFFVRRPKGWRQSLRSSLLEVTPESVRELAPKLDEIAASSAVCVFGNADIIASATGSYKVINLLDA